VEPGSHQTSIALAVELVNSWNTIDSEPERLQSVDDLRKLLRLHGEPALANAVRRRDLERARGLRTNLRRAFEAPNERRAVDALNYVVRGSDARPQLEDGGDWEYAFQSPSSDAISELAMGTGLALLEVIRTRGWERFGLCSATPCIAVYVDLSKNRSRKYCSQLCADRMNQAAYRRRHRLPVALPTPLLIAVASRRRALESLPTSLTGTG
jgi:Putative stress-induced transcription regulator/CGNR zinc finger